MPYDTTIQAMLLSYDKTAQRLMDGEKIEGDELYRFLGVTGVLSVQMQRQLWSQEELKAQIKEEQEQQCKNCPNSKAIEILMIDRSPKPPPPSAPESPQNVWTMMAVSVAQNMKTLIICVVSAILIATLTAIVSGRVAEVASAVATTTSAIHDK